MFSDCQIEIETVNLKDTKRLLEVQDFLSRFGLTFDRNVEYTVNARIEGKLVGTGSFQGEILRNIAIDETIQGLGLTSTIVSALMQEQSRELTPK